MRRQLKSAVFGLLLVSSSFAFAEPTRLADEDRIQYIFALDLGYGGLSGAGLGIPDIANTLQYSAYGMLAFRAKIAGASLALGPYLETGFGRETGALSLLGDRSAMMSGSRYGIGTLARYGNYYLMGALMLLGNLDLNASSNQVKTGSGPDSLSFGGPLGFRVAAGVELKYGVSLHASFTRKSFGNYTYTVSNGTTPVVSTLDVSANPLVDTNFALGLSASY